MSTKQCNTIVTGKINNFLWKRMPIEHEYINIVFCVSDYTNKNLNIFENTLNPSTKKSLKHILNIMPMCCITDIKTYKEFVSSKKINFQDILNEKECKIENLDEKTIKELNEKICKINNKKTYIFSYDEKNKNEILNIKINNEFNDMHKICIGKFENIPKNVLGVSDYIFFDNQKELNKYFESSHHNIRIQNSTTLIYAIDKCNYKDFHLFSFDKYL